MQRFSFPPIVAPGATVLILGSMPGTRSLQLGQYYGHPRNLFWSILGELTGAPPRLPYPERVAKAQAAGVALWDVLEYCERPGSLDADIVAGSEIPNDIPDLLARHPTIQAVAFNGQTAAKSFARYVAPSLAPDTTAHIRWLPLPSTSPANVGIPYAEKVTRWHAALTPYLRV